MQVTDYIKPLYINTDADELLLKEGAVRYLKNYRITFNRNGNVGQGENAGVGTPNEGNVLANPTFTMPAGNNKCIGTFSSIETKELYYFNYNSNGFHGVYVIDQKLNIKIVWLDHGAGNELNFQLSPEYAIVEGRCSLKVVYVSDGDGNRIIKEKHLVFTDSYNWQFWINVLASIGSDSCTSPLSYWQTNDRSEYVQYPVRPPMQCVGVSEYPIVEGDELRPNLLLKKNFQFAYRYILTDGRATAYSPFSNKYSVIGSPCGVDQSGLARCLSLSMNAGSPLVERIELIYRDCGGDWHRYDTLNAFDTCEEKTNYWERDASKRWANYGYNASTNSISYVFCNDKECAIIPQDEVVAFQNDVPIQSQSLVTVGDSVLMSNNLFGYPNFKCDQIDAIKLNLANPSNTNECKVETRKIRVAAVIHNVAKNRNQAIYKTDRGALGCPENTFIFGGLSQNQVLGVDNLLIDTHVYKSYAQNFPVGKNIEGFLGYLPNSNYKTRSKQYRKTGSLIEPWGGISCIGCGTCVSCLRTTITRHIYDNSGYYLQIFEMEVAKGVHPFRIASHLATEDSDYQNTSTYTICTLPYSSYDGKYNLNPDENNYQKEILIDVCEKDWDFEQENIIFVITDNTVPDDALVNNGDTVIETYLKDSGGNPIELAKTYAASQNSTNLDTTILASVLVQAGFLTGVPGASTLGQMALDTVTGARYNNTTDHNGFTWVQFDRQVIDVTGTNKKSLPIKYKGADCSETIWASAKEKSAKLYSLGTNTVNASSIKIKGVVKNCDNNLPLGGVHVMLSRGQGAISKQDGSFEIIAHDGVSLANGIRIDKVIMVQANTNCFAYSCDCDCAIVETINFPTCVTGERVVTCTTNWSLKVSYGEMKGLKGGGRYGWGVVGFDKAGRANFVQKIDYLDIPSFITNGGIFKPSQVGWSIVGDMNLPEWVAYISFFRTANLAHDSYLQWHGDTLEMIDENGAVTGSASAAISYRISIESLLKFNELHFEGTTTKYGFLERDFIRFYANNNGVMYTEYIDLQITQDKEGKYLIIPYDSRIKDMVGKCNFWMEIIRPRTCVDKELYCEVCSRIPVKNGEPLVKQGIFSTWDTYYQTRKISSANPLCANQTTTTHVFESPSVSDFWGENCPSCGRVNVVDEKAIQQWYPDQIAKSNNFVNEGRVNGLGTFKTANRKSFSGQEWGGIVSVIPMQKAILIICENDWFIISYDMNYAKIDNNGFLVSASVEQNIGDPYQKVGSNFGCDYSDIGTIGTHNGLTWWVDKKNAGFILCDMQTAKDVSIEAECKSYFASKLKHIQNFNNGIVGNDYNINCWDIITGYDTKNNEVNITFRPRRQLLNGFSAFVNNEREFRIDHQETIVYNLDLKKFTQTTGYCPEAYGQMSFANNGIQLLSFALGYPYVHNSQIAGESSFNKFFGVETEQVVDFVLNSNPKAIKIFQSLSQNSKEPYHVDLIQTNEKNSISWISLAQVTKKENIYYSTILCDAASYPDVNRAYVSMLYEGKLMRGHWIRMRMVKNIKNLTGYNELFLFSITYLFSATTKKFEGGAQQ